MSTTLSDANSQRPHARGPAPSDSTSALRRVESEGLSFGGGRARARSCGAVDRVPGAASSFGELVGRLVGARLRELRLEAELTQEFVSLRTGIHRPIISRIERGAYCQSLGTVARFAGALGLELLDVLSVLDDHQAELEQLIKRPA